MSIRIYNRCRHGLERFIVRGAAFQLLLVAALIGLISVAAGALIESGTGDAEGLGKSTWWAFLRLTDPGYLGDDTGTYRRVISTIVTVLGYVLFMGSLVAILTQWLNSTIKTLESGVTPVVRNNHFLVLGWSERVGIVVRDLFLSGSRVRRFLAKRGARRLHMVIMSEAANAAMRQDLRTRVGSVWKSSQVTLRSGSALRSDHLSRVDFLNASAVILPAGDFTKVGPSAVDTFTIKTLLSMSNHPAVRSPHQLPLAVAEVLDARKVAVAEAAYAGPLEVLASDAVISRLLAQNIRHKGLSHVYTELLTHREGNELFVRDLPALHGRPFSTLAACFAEAIPIGIVRKVDGELVADLNPVLDVVFRPGERLVLVAREYEDAEPTTADVTGDDGADASAVRHECVPQTVQAQRLLVLGWSHKAPPLLVELSKTYEEPYQVDVLSAVPVVERQEAIARYASELGNVVVTQHLLDYTTPSELEKIPVASYDTVLLLGSDWLSSGEEADARTIVGYLTLHRALASCKKRPHVIVEMLDPLNAGLLGKRPGEVLISPVILSHMLAQISLRRELNVVFEDLFSGGGTEITLRPASDYGYLGVTRTFAQFQRAAVQRDEIALGILFDSDSKKPTVELNPSETYRFCLSDGDKLVVLSDRPVPS